MDFPVPQNARNFLTMTELWASLFNSEDERSIFLRSVDIRRADNPETTTHLWQHTSLTAQQAALNSKSVIWLQIFCTRVSKREATVRISKETRYTASFQHSHSVLSQRVQKLYINAREVDTPSIQQQLQQSHSITLGTIVLYLNLVTTTKGWHTEMEWMLWLTQLAITWTKDTVPRDTARHYKYQVVSSCPVGTETRVLSHITQWPASWSSGQRFWLLIMRSRGRFPALPWGFFPDRGGSPWWPWSG
jgi:hypothetical protein